MDMEKEATTRVTLISFRGVNECTVRLDDGAEVPAVLDVEALRARHGAVYNIRIGDTVDVVHETPLRIVDIEQAG